MRLPVSVPRVPCAVAIVALVSAASAPPAVAKPADVEIPVGLSVLGASGEAASLDPVVTRRLVTDFAGGDPDAVALNARVVHVSEGDGPASSSVEFLESGPVVVP